MPNSIHRFYTLWAINDVLEERRLFDQLDQMRALGFDGVVFHPRFYPNEPVYLSDEYMAVLSRTIMHAKSIGLDFWLYDEDGWPSGTVGGRMLREHPEHAQQWAELALEPPADCICTFTQGGRTWYVARRIGAGVDYLSHAMTDRFIALTHERYRTGLTAAAWDHVSTVFTDEPELGLGHAYDALSPHGAIPWTADLPRLFAECYRESIVNVLPAIFLGGKGSDVARVQFWELMADSLCDSFVAPIDRWCRQHGKRFTGHVKGEEHPLFQVPMVGSCGSFFKAIGLPGVDALERFPSNDYYPRQAASAACQFGDGRVMAECFGGAGWGARPTDLERYLLWLGRLGVTDFVLHLWQYRLDSHAIRDWPASIPNHLSWRGVFPQVIADVKAKLSSSSSTPDTLVVTPHRGIMAVFQPSELQAMNIHNASTYALSDAGILNRDFMATVSDFPSPPHYVDERTVESGQVENGRLKIGNCAYSAVYIDPGCRLSDEMRARLVPLSIGRPKKNDSSQDQSNFRRPRRVIRPDWQLPADQLNDFPLDATRDDDGRWSASFECANEVAAAIVFADHVTDVRFNNDGFANETKDNGSILVFEMPLRVGMHQVSFRSLSKAAVPSLWLHGQFRALPVQAFQAGPNGTVQTAGGFRIHAAMTQPFTSLTDAGYAFSRSPVVISAVHAIEGSSLGVLVPNAASVDVEVAGVAIGSVYRPDQTLPLLGSTQGSLRLSLHASTFNVFGPHHYYAGDHFVVSPDQFAGRRNFADPANAASCTTVASTFVLDVQAPSLTLDSPDSGGG